jgi:beta-N-acetylhexosaminidase
MGALTQGSAQAIDVIAAVRAGIDLLLLTATQADMLDRTISALALAESRRLIGADRLRSAHERRTRLPCWLDGFADPDLDVVGCSEHAALTAEASQRAITIVRDNGTLPLRRGRVLVVQPQPTNLTPADTSEDEAPTLADRIRDRGPT